MSSVETLQERLRRLPAVEHVLQHATVQSLLEEFSRAEVKRAVDTVLANMRSALAVNNAESTHSRSKEPDLARLALQIREVLYDRRQPNLRRVINATGIVLHTGLGRCPLPQAALDAILQTAGGYCNLELTLADNSRGDRHAHVAELLRELTGAEDALVANNNAAATFLALQALAAGREVIVSRGELVEIGGSYRLPDIMAAAGCRMVEVGTTNRTHLYDYENALRPETAAIIRVHTSNYRVQGFTAAVDLKRLSELLQRSAKLRFAADDVSQTAAGPGNESCTQAEDVRTAPVSRRTRRRQSGALQYDDSQSRALHYEEGQSRALHYDAPLLIDDLGSGLLSREVAEMVAAAAGTAAWDEPDVRSSIVDGADVTLFSGDKLLGGPQAGIVVGRREVLARMRDSPLARVVRPDKLTLAALEATLRLYRDPRRLLSEVPALRMLAADAPRLLKRAEALAAECRAAAPGAAVSVAQQDSYAGGGSLPTLALPSYVVRIVLPQLSAEAAHAGLRSAETPVVCRVSDGALVLDCRTISDDEIAEIGAALAGIG